MIFVTDFGPNRDEYWPSLFLHFLVVLAPSTKELINLSVGGFTERKIYKKREGSKE